LSYRGFSKEILELHKRGDLGDESPPAGRRSEVSLKLKHVVVCCHKL